MEDIIEGTLTDERIVVDQLEALHWKMQGDYLVALINTTEDNDGIRQHIMTLLTAEIAAQCFTYHGNTVIIFNESTKRRKAIGGRLSSLARSFNRTVAVSERFGDFSQIDRFYNQAYYALQIADANDARGEVLEYGEVFLDHLSEITSASFPCFEPVLQLQKHDQEHGSDLCHTLLTWLMNDRNTIQTAAELYVHRNTLKNRLTRIVEITGVDFNDYKVRMRTEVSLHNLLWRQTCQGSAAETTR